MDFIRAKCYDNSANINVYVPADCKIITTPYLDDGKLAGFPLYGLANPDDRFCAVADEGDILNPHIEVLDTIAHEIGHIMIGPGHPDRIQSGPAPLPGTDHKRRLMAFGTTRKPDGNSVRLVKAEWDRIENWLHQFVDTH